jgi:hypothetical protein
VRLFLSLIVVAGSALSISRRCMVVSATCFEILGKNGAPSSSHDDLLVDCMGSLFELKTGQPLLAATAKTM